MQFSFNKPLLTNQQQLHKFVMNLQMLYPERFCQFNLLTSLVKCATEQYFFVLKGVYRHPPKWKGNRQQKLQPVFANEGMILHLTHRGEKKERGTNTSHHRIQAASLKPQRLKRILKRKTTLILVKYINHLGHTDSKHNGKILLYFVFSSTQVVFPKE